VAFWLRHAVGLGESLGFDIRRTVRYNEQLDRRRFATTLLEVVLLSGNRSAHFHTYLFCPIKTLASNDGCPLDRILPEKMT
jgi:hypothetical protein